MTLPAFPGTGVHVHTAGLLRICGSGDGAQTGAPDVVGRVRRALVALREPTSTEHLECSVPAAVAMLGFERVVYARLRGADWRPTAARSGADAVDVSAAIPVEVHTALAEFPVLVEQVPVVVGPGCEHRLLPVEWCRSYVAVPVLERGAVVGLIHAGHRDPARRLTALDQEMLWVFSEALTPSFAAARAGDALRDLMGRMTRFAGELGQFGCTPVGEPPVAALPDVSGREREVLALMAAGQTNGQIARRLVITEGTVKSHVKRIMRKLHAANRAEAVAAWMRYAVDARTYGASAS
jgi:DNA-binding CsgD family transcriptional regulator